MDKEQERVLVQSFFVKRVQERVLHELFTPKKRDMALQRLDHRYLSMLKNDYLIEIKPPNSWPDDTYDLLKQYGAPDTCYCLSENEMISGKTLPLREALEHAIGFGFASIISCIPGELAYFEAEQSFGPPPRYLLKKPSNR
ncbi:hypothetical protein ESP131_09435 [Exiguobacterium sp. U13-1]|uniref:Uncharacterized protein n=1 Tax=Exiguobacterium acetylicum TaxID=41170 RepID=A0ABX8GCU2_EXIAC|nr:MULTISPECIES: hypothetical protein [Exiguobacterium]AOT00466.1 hypothetical protein ESP131_09435 [Exiguobacterium sp. U13-1]QWB31429.1 hypothetical protein KKI46_07225 [Exiguobacterium acetylicum]